MDPFVSKCGAQYARHYVINIGSSRAFFKQNPHHPFAFVQL